MIPATQAFTSGLAAQMGQLRAKIQQSIGQVILAVMDQSRNRVAIAHKSVTENGTAKVDEDAIAGIAIWASVSPAVDAKIAEQVKAGVFPVRLAPEDWTSGDTPWLLDVIAGDRQQATSVLANFRQLAGDKLVRIHPIVGRLIDPAVLEKLKASSTEQAMPKTARSA